MCIWETAGRIWRINTRTLGVAAALAVACSFTIDVAAATPATQPLRRQNVTPGLAHAVKLRHADPNRTMNVAVSLQLRNQAALQDFIQKVSDRRSPIYGHYLKPAQFAAAYGPTIGQAQQVVDYLQGHGLTVTPPTGSRTVIDASGPVRAIESAFGVTINDWHDRDENRDFFGNDAQPSLPSSIAPAIVGVLGLNNHYRLQRIGAAYPSRLSPRVAPGGGPNGGYTPAELKAAYDVNPKILPNAKGAGQSLGLFELDDFVQSNVAVYDAQYGLNPTPPVRIVIDGGPPPGGGQVEVELDIEVMHALAPSASVTVWEGPNSDVGAIDTYYDMVNADITTSNSTSWGSCEPLTQQSTMNAIDQLFQQAATQGQTFYAASGDTGAYDCRGNPNLPTTHPLYNTLTVDYPASDPYVTGVGGTALSLNPNHSWLSETAWSDASRTPPRGSGGGHSGYFARPAWQTGPGFDANGGRHVPDVALDADPRTGYSVYTTFGPTDWFVIGGTSAGAPAWAAFTALYNEYAAARGELNLGFANPILYDLANNPPAQPTFHDVTTGDNLFYSAGVGWDYPTGWGSPYVARMIFELAGSPAPLSVWADRAANNPGGGSAGKVRRPRYPVTPLRQVSHQLRWWLAPVTPQ